MTAMKTGLLASAGLLLLSTAAQAQSTIYSTGFSDGTTGAFTGGVAAKTASGERYLELAQSATSTATFNTASYTGLTVSFNLYGIESVDGNGPQGNGPDPFLITVNGVQLYNISIANYGGGNTQSYNGNLAQSGPGNTYAPGTGEIAAGTLGYGTGSFGDSTYLVNFTIPNAVTTTISFTGATNEAASNSDGTTGGNEAYGVDNFRLTGTAVSGPGAVPEPASWAMMIAGFGMMGAGLRYRRRRPQLRYS